MDIILRNLERLVNGGASGEKGQTGQAGQAGQAGQKEQMEPMSAWKWRRLYDLARKYGMEPWVADGMRAYADDFFLQPPADLREQMTYTGGQKEPERLERFFLMLHRSGSPLNRFSRESLRAYAKDFIQTVKNIEE